MLAALNPITHIPVLNMPLNIVIIGAGLGGLAAALSIKKETPTHDVFVVESAPVLAEASLSKLVFVDMARLQFRDVDWCRSPTHPECYTTAPKVGFEAQPREAGE